MPCPRPSLAVASCSPIYVGRLGQVTVIFCTCSAACAAFCARSPWSPAMTWSASKWPSISTAMCTLNLCSASHRPAGKSPQRGLRLWNGSRRTRLGHGLQGAAVAGTPPSSVDLCVRRTRAAATARRPEELRSSPRPAIAASADTPCPHPSPMLNPLRLSEKAPKQASDLHQMLGVLILPERLDDEGETD